MFTGIKIVINLPSADKYFIRSFPFYDCMLRYRKKFLGGFFFCGFNRMRGRSEIRKMLGRHLLKGREEGKKIVAFCYSNKHCFHIIKQHNYINYDGRNICTS